MGQKYTRGGPPSASEQMQEAASADMLYRAMEGYDKLAYDPKCGFDIDQLRQLFPEEMLAYNRWNEVSRNQGSVSSLQSITVPLNVDLVDA